ncbi:MAG: helix-turn-helix domain-containing protein [Cyanobacteria bacterium J06626_18]
MAQLNQYSETRCPIQYVLEIVGSKWAILILRELFVGSRRTHEFLEALPGISTKTLTARLRELERYGLVTRKVYAEVPPRVEYSLTEKGLELQPVMQALRGLGEQWLQTIPSDRPSHTDTCLEPETLSA